MRQYSSYSRVEKQKKARRKRRIAMLSVTLAGIVLIALFTATSGFGSKLITLVFDQENETNEQPHQDEDRSNHDSADSNVDSENQDRDTAGSNDSNDIADPNDRDDQQQQENDQSTAELKLTFVGDVLLGSTVENLLLHHGYDYPYEYVIDHFRNSDIVAANLETPITERGEPDQKQYVYRSKPDVLPAFKNAGFDIVTLANNHILDYGQEGLLDTLDYLDEIGILWTGAGRDEQEAYESAVLEVNGVKIAFLGLSYVVPRNEWKATPYQPGVAETYSLTRPVEAIEKAKEMADLVIVLAHWGNERETAASERQIDAAHAYIDAGADLVIGSHPHVLQGFEQYNGKWIAYSLGNFIFTTNASHQLTWEGGILHASCTPEGDCDLELVPVWNQWAKPKPMEAADRMRVFERLETEGVEISEDGRVIKIPEVNVSDNHPM